ncbi:hypothetical protein F4806DRAFT_481247 [Annulohypoxylon nitens]|nr:hypothetical protein F4806DRAFT_481247 [Annulohypoxylon nitens]
MDWITNLYNSFKNKAYQLWTKSTMRPEEKAAENDQQLQNIIAMLRAEAAAAEAIEDDGWGPEYEEDWNPAQEAREARQIKEWKESQLQALADTKPA